MPKKSALYEPLLDKDGLYDDSEQTVEAQYQRPLKQRLLSRRTSIPVWMIAIFALFQATTMILLTRVGFERGFGHANPQLLYSPAASSLEYQVVKFRSGLNGEADDIYSRPPSDEVDAAWAGLYDSVGVSELNQEQADKLANFTMQVPNSDHKYVMLLDVFHELHCLNNIRKALHSQYYYNDTNPVGNPLRALHIKHCLGSLRQSIQCSSDISTIVWRKHEGEREAPQFDIVHSCRNFEKIQAWAGENRGSIFVQDGRISATPDGFSMDGMAGHDHH
ncbi:hypothetical protein H0H87_003041 [Tephrocybe sp. NHM501043]|nr:hypothetical protein H0H87_003041 [Tephrocybe sp. NHM501043]